MAAGIRCLPILVKTTWKPENKNLLYQTDSPGYEQLGLDMQRKGWWQGQDDGRTPLYPWFIAKIYQVTGPHPFWVVLAQIWLTALSSGFLLWMGVLLGKERVGQVASVIWSFSPAAMIYSNYLYTEALYTFLFLLSCALFLAFIAGRRRAGFLIASGVSFAFSTLARPINTFIPAALVLSFAFLPDRSWRRLAAWTGIFLLSYGLCLAPRLARMKTMTGGVMISTMLHANLQEIHVYMDPYLKSAAPFNEQHPHLIYRVGHRLLGGYISAAQTRTPEESPSVAREIRFWKGKVLEKILRYPGVFAKMYAKGLSTLFFTPASNDFFELWGIPGHRIEFGVRSATGFRQSVRAVLGGKSLPQLLYIGVFSLVTLIFYAFFLVGSRAMIRGGKTAEWLVFILPLAVLTLWIGTHGTLRYRMPMEPLILLVAVYGSLSIRRRRAPPR